MQGNSILRARGMTRAATSELALWQLQSVSGIQMHQWPGPISKWGDECGKDEENIAAAQGMLSQLLPDAYIVSMHEGGAPVQVSPRQTSAQQVFVAHSGQAPARSAAGSAMQHVCCWCAPASNPLNCMCQWSMSQQHQQCPAWQCGQHNITTMLHKAFKGAVSWRS